MGKKQIIKRIFLATMWIAIGAGTVVLLVAAIQKKDEQRCTEVEISIQGVNDNFFVDKNDILQTIEDISGEPPVGKSVGSFNLKAIESALQKNVWIKSAQLFFDNNEKLQVNVLEREPVARVFSTTGTTFYIDSTIAMLPLSEKFSARLPVFTGFPSDKKVLLRADSGLLREILDISTAIRQDSFYMAMIDQVDITPQRNFEMIPKFGNTIIVFGDGRNAQKKLGKLQLFYKEIMVKAGWNKYSEINVQYNNQVVVKRKGAAEIKADSLRTLQLMKIIAENAEKLSSDSLQVIGTDNENNTTNNNIILQSIERDENNPSANTIEEPKPQVPDESAVSSEPVKSKPAATVPAPGAGKKATVPAKKPATPTVKKPIAKPAVKEVKKPKLLMPKRPAEAPKAKNDY